ncbi:MAG: protein TolR [Granulosicoccaceae bacterium]
MHSSLRRRKRMMSEINVVPYIDVMLVLLVIFMVTAPLLTQGVNVELPQVAAEPVKVKENLDPLVVSVDKDGNFYVDIGDDRDKPLDHDGLFQKVYAITQNYKPGTPVLVKGDKDARYGDVVIAMALIQKAGVPNVGLMTESPPGEDQR